MGSLSHRSKIDISIELISTQTYLKCSIEFGNTELEKDHSPHGIALRANNSILIEEIFHGASPVK